MNDWIDIDLVDDFYHNYIEVDDVAQTQVVEEYSKYVTTEC